METWKRLIRGFALVATAIAAQADNADRGSFSGVSIPDSGKGLVAMAFLLPLLLHLMRWKRKPRDK